MAWTLELLGMARSIRIEFPGAFYHVMARGNRREAIFFGDEDRVWLLKTLGEACAKTGWRVHAWVLMDNHYHLMMETPEANLVEGMKWLQNTFTRRFNTKQRCGTAEIGLPERSERETLPAVATTVLFALVFVSVLIASELDPINRVDCEKGRRHHGERRRTG